MPVLRPALFAALRRTLPVGVALLSLAVAQSALAAPPPTGVLTYTGQLLTSLNPPTPASGTYDFQFQLFSAATGGTQVGTTQSVPAVPVADGVFYAEINFGSVIGTPGLYLQTSYRASGTTAYTVQSPRKKLTESGYADYAAYASYAGTAGNTQGLAGKYVSTTAPTTGQVLTYNGTLWAPATPASGGSYTAGTGLTLTGSKFSVAVPLALSGSSSSPILRGSNAGAGVGVYGINTGNGDYGFLGGTDPQYGDPVGVFGSDTSSAGTNGVFGLSTNGTGTAGVSTGGFGVYAVSANNDGMQGHSADGSHSGVAGVSDASYGGYGVYGVNRSTGDYGFLAGLAQDYNSDYYPAGVYGYDDSSGGGEGVKGYSMSGDGVEGDSDSGEAVVGETKTGFAGHSTATWSWGGRSTRGRKTSRLITRWTPPTNICTMPASRATR